jgi:DNA-binding transcriptional regulator YiaG
MMYDTNTMDGNDIRKLRKFLKLTSGELGHRLGVTANTVRRWECGVRRARGPAARMLREMAAAKPVAV